MVRLQPQSLSDRSTGFENVAPTLDRLAKVRGDMLHGGRQTAITESRPLTAIWAYFIGAELSGR